MQTDIYDPTGLIVGHLPAVHEVVTIVEGQNLVRGAVVGRITASGKYTLSLSASADGSEVPRGVIAVDCDATAADKVAPVFFVGEFADKKVTLGTGHTVDSVNAAFRGQGAPIFIRKLG